MDIYFFGIVHAFTIINIVFTFDSPMAYSSSWAFWAISKQLAPVGSTLSKGLKARTLYL